MTAVFDPSFGQNAQGQYDYNPNSNDPGDATGYYSTLQQAQQAAAQADPQYAGQINSAAGAGVANNSVAGAPANAPGSNLPGTVGAPAAASAGTTTGLPTAANVAADAPLPLQSFGATPTVTPSYASAATVNPNATPQYLGQEEAANAASLQPQFQAQDQSEQDQLAARGISSSGAAQDLTTQLYGQQAAQLASMNAPAIQQQSGYQQADLTGNAAAQNTANLTNAAAGTAASVTNAGYYDQALTGNATTYNNYLSTLEGQGYNTSNEAYTAYLNSFGPNSGVTSGYNGAVGAVGNAATGAYDSSTAAQGQALGSVFGAAGSAASAGSIA